MNSFGGSTAESLIITYSFDHVHDHRPKNCFLSPSQATLDKYQFSDVDQEEMKREEADEIRKHRHHNETHAVHEEEDEDHVHDGSSEHESEEEIAASFL